MTNAHLADLVLIVHFAFVLFVVGGLGAIWIGAIASWDWVRNRRFRMAHLCAICFVALEAILGIMCPLTVWEDALRGRVTEQGLIERTLHALMFFELPPWVFTTAYIAFAAAVVATFFAIPPRRRGAGHLQTGPSG